MEVKVEDQAIKFAGFSARVASPDYSPQVAEEMWKLCEALYSVCAFHNAYFRWHLDEHELPHRAYLLDSVDSFLWQGR